MAINTERLSQLFHKQLHGKNVFIEAGTRPKEMPLDDPVIAAARKITRDGASVTLVYDIAETPERHAYTPPESVSRADRTYLLDEAGGVKKANDHIIPWLSDEEIECILHNHPLAPVRLASLRASTHKRLLDALNLLKRGFSPTVTIIDAEHLSEEIDATNGVGTECFRAKELSLQRVITDTHQQLLDALWNAYQFIERSEEETAIMRENAFVIGPKGSDRMFGGVSIIPNDTDANGVPHSAELARVFGAGMGRYIIPKAVNVAYDLLQGDTQPHSVIFAVTDQPKVARVFQSCRFSLYQSLRLLQWMDPHGIPHRLKEYPWTDTEDRLVLEYPCCLGKFPEHH